MRAFAFSHRGTQVKEALRSGVLTLQKAHIETASLDARILLEHVLGVTRERLLMMYDLSLSYDQEAAYRDIIERRAKRQPVAHLTGHREFWGMDFHVTEATLDPRADSETLVEGVLSHVADRKAALRILDLGTGTGCLLLSLLKELPNAKGVGVDICKEALSVACGNAEHNELAERVTFIRSRWEEKLEGAFDIIISNPPYIPAGDIAGMDPEVAHFEPKLALDGGNDGLDAYRHITPALPRLLAAGGLGAFEIGIGQEASVKELLQRSGLNVIDTRLDIQAIPRCILFKKLL